MHHYFFLQQFLVGCDFLCCLICGGASCGKRGKVRRASRRGHGKNTRGPTAEKPGHTIEANISAATGALAAPACGYDVGLANSAGGDTCFCACAIVAVTRPLDENCGAGPDDGRRESCGRGRGATRSGASSFFCALAPESQVVVELTFGRRTGREGRWVRRVRRVSAAMGERCRSGGGEAHGKGGEVRRAQS